MNILNNDGTIYINKNHEWTTWLRDNKGQVMARATKMTVAEYRKVFLNKRPDWVKTFAERKIPSSDLLKNVDKHFQHVLGEGENRFHLEREIVEIDNAPVFVVERLLSKRRHCKQLITLTPEEDGVFRYQQENWFPGGRWVVSEEFTFKEKEGFYTDRDFLRATISWDNFFNK